MKSKQELESLREEHMKRKERCKQGQMIVRIVALEGLQPMVTEAFMKKKGNNQCGLEGVKEPNGGWEVMTIVIIMIIIIGFAAMTFPMWKLYKHCEKKCMNLKRILGDGVDGTKLEAIDIEWMFDQVEGDGERISTLQDYN